METLKMNSQSDNLALEVAMIEPTETPKGIIQFSHGMSEHKERYYDFMQYLASNGYVCIIHDHRGHGASIKETSHLGYFYTEDMNYIVNDLYQVTQYIKDRYDGLSVTLFSHSMGTMVSRNYLKKYDQQIDKIVLCGPPTENKLAGVGVILAKIMNIFLPRYASNKILDKMTTGRYNQGFKEKNEWLCSNEKVVSKYNADELCGYTFTTNGFINLFQLLKESFNIKNWNVQNKDLDIFILAGEDDPVIQNKNKFEDLGRFLKKLGYRNITSKLYQHKRHELLNEIDNEVIYKDVLNFIENDTTSRK